jgi:hypothetical protein
VRIGFQVDIAQEIEAVEVVSGAAVFGQERPAVLAEEMVDDRHGDQVFEFFQLAEDQCAVRPRASEGDVEMIAARLCFEAALAARRGLAVSGNPVTETGFGPYEFTADHFRFDAFVTPYAIDKQSHR